CGMLFFFSSRRRHTRFSRDWSSDVCSSDLNVIVGSDRADWIAGLNLWTDRFRENGQTAVPLRDYNQSTFGAFVQNNFHAANWLRSEERRVGKECRYRWSTAHDKQHRS